jgi:hypothetical protein
MIAPAAAPRLILSRGHDAFLIDLCRRNRPDPNSQVKVVGHQTKGMNRLAKPFNIPKLERIHQNWRGDIMAILPEIDNRLVVKPTQDDRMKSTGKRLCRLRPALNETQKKV